MQEVSPICVKFYLSLVRRGHGIPLIFHGKVMEFHFSKGARTLCTLLPRVVASKKIVPAKIYSISQKSVSNAKYFHDHLLVSTKLPKCFISVLVSRTWNPPECWSVKLSASYTSADHCCYILAYTHFVWANGVAGLQHFRLTIFFGHILYPFYRCLPVHQPLSMTWAKHTNKELEENRNMCHYTPRRVRLRLWYIYLVDMCVNVKLKNIILYQIA